MLKILGLDRLAALVSRKVLYLWVRTKVFPQDLSSLNLNPDQPVCYVLQTRQLSPLLVLENETQELKLPRALSRMKSGWLKEDRSFFFLTRAEKPTLLQPNRFEYSPRLKRLIHEVQTDSSLDVQLVPVTILWGRSPDKQNSLVKILFTDSWATPGVLKQLFTILLHGRQTIVKFNDPVSLRALVDENLGEERTLRKLARVLRVHFHRQREMAIGPDLSHRRTQVNSLLRAPSVAQAISDEALAKSVPQDKAYENARRYALEIAADYSYPIIRSLEVFLNWLWTRLYDGVDVQRLDEVANIAPGHEVIYVPCHRSHIDYLLLSYVIFTHGMMVPHIAAGANLNLPVVGSILRGGGAFFLRRSFKGNNLYAAVFNEYMHMMISKGFPMEYFIEGGRSRTGRLLQPKGGMLAMTLQSYMRDHSRPIVFVPIYFGYERVMEGKTYVAELLGKPKEKESIFGLIKTLRDIERVFGKVHVNFGQPIYLNTLLDQQHPNWKEESGNAGGKTPWVVNTVDTLANQIVTRINSAAVANPITLLSLALLSTPKQAMDEEKLVEQLDLYRLLLTEVPYSDRIGLTELDGKALIEYGARMKILQRVPHPLGNVVVTQPEQAMMLTYFRNNILHMYTVPALIACYLTHNAELTRQQIIELIGNVYPFLQSELFLHWQQNELAGVISRYIDVYVQQGLLTERPEVDLVFAPRRNSPEFVKLEVLAQAVQQNLERYYITIALLTRQGSGKITQNQLEELCSLFAQRLSLLHEFSAPEFFDQTIFRNFIQTLSKAGLLKKCENDLLVFDVRLQATADEALFVLPAEIRQTIHQMTRIDQDAMQAALKASAEKTAAKKAEKKAA
jgi:glycerol-3-phosphate O-acyltransferase